MKKPEDKIDLIEKYGSERKAAAALGMKRQPFRVMYFKSKGLCISCGKVPFELDRTRCRPCLNGAKTKKSPEEIREKNQAYYETNRDEILKNNREYQKRTLGKSYHSRKKYDQTEKGRATNAKKREIRRSIEDGKLSGFELKYIEEQFHNKCFKCGIKQMLTVDHTIPLVLGGKLALDNITILCGSCNSSKQDRHPEVYYSQEKRDELRLIINNIMAFTNVKSVKEYQISEITSVQGRADCKNFIQTHHYLGKSPNYSRVFTLSYKGLVIGVCAYSKPSRQNITIDDRTDILELSRLFILDGTPKNAESYFVGGTLKLLKKEKKFYGIVSYADPTHGHTAIIYRAANFKFESMTRKNHGWQDSNGEYVHKRQVWDRAKRVGRTEDEQAEFEGLTKTMSLPKYKYIYLF